MIWTVLLIILLLWALALLFAVLRNVFVFLGLRSRKKRHSSSRDWERRRKCLPLPDDVYRRPDPCIYAQYYLMSQGFAVTWDNPDIWLQLNGVPVPSSSLQPDTEYDLVARVWNNSTEAPAVDLPVHFAYLDFGIGTSLIAIGVTKVDLPVKGAAGHPALAQVKWKTPAAGHYCLLVNLAWADDANPHNNLGQENTDVQPLNSPKAAFTFPLRNEEDRARSLTLEADFYQPPAAPRCPAAPARQPTLAPDEIKKRQREALARHGREHFAVPEDWTIEIRPQKLSLEPGEQAEVTVDVTAPDDFTGRQAINVNAFDGERLVGGVTLYVE